MRDIGRRLRSQKQACVNCPLWPARAGEAIGGVADAPLDIQKWDPVRWRVR
jgi:hypothetical protein